MAVRAGFLLLLLLIVQLCVSSSVVSGCVVSCTTDYETLLNCSCSGLEPPEPPEPLLLQVLCRLDDLVLNESCAVSVRRPFCVVYPDVMEEIADVETECSANAVRARDGARVTEASSSSWQLRSAVKPWPPSNIHVTMTEASYNITWVSRNSQRCLIFRVRVRTCGEAGRSEVIEDNSTRSSVLVDRSRLLPGLCHRADVQAKLCPGSPYRGPWSEWSAPAFWTTAAVTRSARTADTEQYYWLLTLPFVVVLLLAFPKVMLQQKRFKVMAYIPNPGEFFKPLYISYQGNFKAWVKPAFAEHSSVMDAGPDVKLDHWDESALLSPDFGPLGSISTVTLGSPCSLAPEGPPDDSSDLGELETQKRPSLNLSSLHIVQDVEEEELSGNEYPLMDLDTIDSGFGECSSPPLCPQCQSDSGPATEPLATAPLAHLYHSNYVKQWTIGQPEGEGLQPSSHEAVCGTGEQ